MRVGGQLTRRRIIHSAANLTIRVTNVNIRHSAFIITRPHAALCDRLDFAKRRHRHRRVHAEHWTIPENLPERGLAYDHSLAGEGPGIKVASQLSLGRQIGAKGADGLR